MLLAGGPGEAAASVALSYVILVRNAAEGDVLGAQQWYEAQQPGLAAKFQFEFGATLDRLAETPLIYPVLYRGVRRAVLHRFPILVWYRVQGFNVTVLACTHGKADPGEVPTHLGRE